MAIIFNEEAGEAPVQPLIQGEPQPKTMQELFREYTPKPKPLDERKVALSRNIAGVGEGLMLLGQMVGARRGARINPMQLPSPTESVQAREDALRSVYSKRTSDYNAGLIAAAQQDVIRAETAKRERDANERYQKEFEFGKDRFKWQQEQARIEREDRKSREIQEAADKERAFKLQERQVNLSYQNTMDALNARMEDSESRRLARQIEANVESYAARAKADSQWIANNADRVYMVKPSPAGSAIKTEPKMIDDKTLAYMYYAEKNGGADIFQSTIGNTKTTNNQPAGGKSRM